MVLVLVSDGNLSSLAKAVGENSRKIFPVVHKTHQEPDRTRVGELSILHQLAALLEAELDRRRL